MTRRKAGRKKPKKTRKRKKEGNLFDKIFHEISDNTMVDLSLEFLGDKVRKKKYVKTKMQTTYERETDGCYFIETEKGNEFILHLEYQSTNDPMMVFRIFQYVAMLTLLYPGKKIKSTVIYVGKAKVNMRTKLTPEETYTGFDLIDAKELDHKKLLTSNDPDTVVLAILSNYPKTQAKEIIYKTIERLRELSKTQKDLIQFCYRLQVLSFLRNLGEETNKILKNMAIHFDVSKTKLFKTTFKPKVLEFERLLQEERMAKEQEQKAKELERKAKERERKAKDIAIKANAKAVQKLQFVQRNMITHLLQNDSMPPTQIAQLTNTELSFVLKIKDELI